MTPHATQGHETSGFTSFSRPRPGPGQLAVPAPYRRRVPSDPPKAVDVAVAALDEGREPPTEAVRTAVRELLRTLARTFPGRTIEVRIPPWGAVQCGEGPRHTRGTPPNVVETDPVTWLRLATGRLAWSDAVAAGAVRASGSRADLSDYLPLP